MSACEECSKNHKQEMDGSMRWHKLADEKPTEDGVKYIAYNGDHWWVENLYDLINFGKMNGVTHWLLITPPERERVKCK